MFPYCIQNDLAASMQEMVKSQKIYSEEEKQAHETRLKAMNIEDKLRRRSTNLFSTMAQLHRNHVKVFVLRVRLSSISELNSLLLEPKL